MPFLCPKRGEGMTVRVKNRRRKAEVSRGNCPPWGLS
jgi:predicted RNA-binding Zn-ribbon protein involved in translation (DUF1610 family)